METRLWSLPNRRNPRRPDAGGGKFLWPALHLSQLGAFIPLMMLAVRDKKSNWTALAGLYMGLAFAIPQMIYLRMPIPVTLALMFEFILWLTALCLLAGWCIKYANNPRLFCLRRRVVSLRLAQLHTHPHLGYVAILCPKLDGIPAINRLYLLHRHQQRFIFHRPLSITGSTVLF